MAIRPATLDDNETSRDFVSLLPLTLTLEDYSATEKISDLPKRLSTKSTPPGLDPSIGDITCYAPWGNLAMFYKDSAYARGLVKIGTLDSGVEAFRVPRSLKVTIHRVDSADTDLKKEPTRSIAGRTPDVDRFLRRQP